MVYQNIFGAVIASLLGFAFLYRLRGKKKARALVKTDQNGNCLKSSENGICEAKISTSTDIIIVGAGVVGSALAYTLGKVKFSNSLRGSCLFGLNLIHNLLRFKVLWNSMVKLLCVQDQDGH